MILLSSLVLACGPTYLKPDDFEEVPHFSVSPDSEVPDSQENLDILDTVIAYQQALISRDISSLRPLISRSYYENASSTDDTSDDYGFELLEDLYRELERTVQEVRYDIEVLHVERTASVAHVDYSYEWAFRLRIGDSDIWKADRNVNRLTLVLEEGRWKISGGL